MYLSTGPVALMCEYWEGGLVLSSIIQNLNFNSPSNVNLK